MATMPSTKPLPSGPKSLNLPKLVSEENLFAEVTIPAWALYHLTDKLNTLLSSGFSLQQAFPVLRKSLPTRENYSFVDRLRHKADPLTIMRSIENDIMDRGYLLSQAMERFPRVFDTHYISLIKAGEKSGCLVSNGDDRAILDMLLEHLERQTSIKAQVKDNLRYPLIVLGIMLLVLLVMGYVVLPFFKEFLAALIPDPNNIFLPTRIMFFVADFFTDYWYIPLLVIGGLTAAGVTAYQSPQGQRRVHEYQLKVTVFQKLILAELLSLMATLVAAGLNWGEVLKLMQQSATNIEIKEALEQAHTHIYEGIALPEAFRRAHWLFDGLTHSILQVAITTGATEQTLRNHSNKLLNEAVREINAWLTYFQPAMIVTLGVIVGFIVISFYGGMSTLIQGLGK